MKNLLLRIRAAWKILTYKFNWLEVWGGYSTEMNSNLLKYKVYLSNNGKIILDYYSKVDTYEIFDTPEEAKEAAEIHFFKSIIEPEDVLE